jgi:glycosyltransferase involved in cell wall biosynthesis
MKVFFVDTVSGFGGGQVVLDQLESSLCGSGVSAEIIKKANLFENLKLVRRAAKLSSYRPGEFAKTRKRTVMVANANRSLLHVVILRLFLRAISVKTSVLFIAHNYPKNHFRSLALRFLSLFVHYTICVDPSLERYFFKAVSAPLLVTAGEVNRKSSAPTIVPRVVSYQRADKVKGGLRLPPIFRILASKGYNCEIALDASLDGDHSYSEQLFRELSPWLVSGRKDQMWLQHGDIFILSSFSETAALSAQEAIYRGCYVIASNVGIIQELGQIAPAIRVVDPWTTDSVCKQVLEISSLSAQERQEDIKVSQVAISAVSGKWIEFVTSFILDLMKVDD